MCGRFTLRSPASVIAEEFAVFEQPDLQARFNISPIGGVAFILAWLGVAIAAVRR